MKSNDDRDTTKNERRPGGMSEQRHQRIRLEISREAARLFWEQGVAATSGEQIAAAVGLSVRTIWRYFRNKGSCAEPVLAQDVEEFVAVLRRWPREVSLADHLVEWAVSRPQDPDQQGRGLKRPNLGCECDLNLAVFKPRRDRRFLIKGESF